MADLRLWTANPQIRVSQEQLMWESIPIQGLNYQPVPGDGHCLFHAVGFYLGQDQQQLRQEVADYIETHLDELREPLRGLLRERTIEDYLQAVREGREWADDLEIAALMYVYHRPIIVVGPNGRIRNLGNTASVEGDPIFIHYNGHNHYNALVLDGTREARELWNELIQWTALPQMQSSQDQLQTSLIQHILELTKQFNKLEIEKQQAKEVLKNIHRKNGDLTARLESQSKILTNLETQVESLQTQLSGQRKKLEEKNKEIQQVNAQYQTLMTRKQQLESDHRELRESHAQVVEEKTHLEERRNDLSADNAIIQQQLAEKESIIRIKLIRIASLEKELQRAQILRETQTRATSPITFFGHAEPRQDEEGEEAVTNGALESKINVEEEWRYMP